MKRLTILLLAMHLSLTAKADLLAPFATSNINPFVLVHGLPDARPAQLVPHRVLAWKIQADVANNFTSDTKPFDSILIDGETYRANLSLSYGFSDGWEVGVVVPYIRHEPGQLDSFIEGFHDILGLSEAGRDQVPRNLLNYDYRSGASNQSLDKSVNGIGDIRLNLGYRIREHDNRVWSIRGGIKLPTGDADDFTGSEGTDVSVGLHLSEGAFLGKESLTFHGSLGVLVLGDGEFVEDQVEDWAVYGSSTLAWRLSPRFSLKAQFDFHSALYDTGFDEIGSFAGQLVLGGSVILGKKVQLDVSVSEDIIVNTAPDVVFNIALRSRF